MTTKNDSKYILKIVDESTFDEVFSTEFSRNKIFIWLSSLFVGSIIIALLILAFTPLKYYIPGYGSPKTEKEAIALKNKLDSLTLILNEQQSYVSNVRAAITGKNNKVRDTTLLDMKRVKKEDMNSILPKPEEIKKDAAASLKKEKNGKKQTK